MPEYEVTTAPERSTIALRLSGDAVASYHLGGSATRPYLERLIAPGGHQVTRSLDGNVPDDSRDHPHHRGIWWGHRNVDGADFWTEFEGHGRIAEEIPADVRHSSDEWRVAQHLQWVAPAGDVRLRERRITVVRRSAKDGAVLIDMQTTLMTPGRDPVTLRDTKEAGLIAVRVAIPMEERRGGRIENAMGDVGEARCWGRPANWCDYSGRVDGTVVGVAVLDHPDNPRHPTCWHVRDYGLLAANPFGYSDFWPGQGRDGTLVLDPGEHVTFRFRLVAHQGDARTGLVAQHFAAFAETAPLEA
jgi:Family of unknown function (DUF6807)